MHDILLINPNTEKDAINSIDSDNNLDELDKTFFKFKESIFGFQAHKKYNREPPSGILLLAAILETQEYDVAIFDCSVFSDYQQELTKTVGEYRLFGITALTNTLDRAIKVAQIIKRINSQAIIIIGGPHASFCYSELLEKYPVIDLVAVGEAENVILQLMDLLLTDPINILAKDFTELHLNKQFDPKKLPSGFALRLEKATAKPFFPNAFERWESTFEIFFNQWPEPVDINQNPLPARHLLHHPYDIANVSFNRGCSNQCSFCSRQRLFKNNVRIRSLTQIQEELTHISTAYKYKFVNFYDNINLNPTIFRQFLHLLIDMRFTIPWGCELRADILTEDDCLLLKRAGCVGVATGIESADPIVLKANFKYQDPAKVAQGIKALKKAKIVVQSYFVIGLPGETWASFRTTLAYLQGLGLDSKDEINFFIATPYPGSRLVDEENPFLITIKDRDYRHYDCEHFMFETSHLKKQDVYQMYQEAMLLVQKIKTPSK